jgi:4-hydroxybenzoate polyprenyltransferase
MTYKSIKLLALAVIFGCSLIGLVLLPWGHDLRSLIILAALIVTGMWFLIYWFLCEERQR